MGGGWLSGQCSGVREAKKIMKILSIVAMTPRSINYRPKQA